jgi:hypothetical protein
VRRRKNGMMEKERELPERFSILLNRYYARYETAGRKGEKLN